MRHWMFLVVAFSFLSVLAGCKCHSSSHGVCDCEFDDHCSTRTPWIRNTPPVVGEIIAPPVKMPDGKKKDL